MADVDPTGRWMLAHPALARGFLLTAARHLDIAQREVAQLMGYLDGKEPEARYLELGMNLVMSQLSKVVRALDMQRTT